MRDQPVETRHTVNGQSIAVWQWPGESPAVVLCHATGFHARCWDRIIERLPGRRCVAIDFRGHGRSSKPPAPYPWRAFGDDLAAVLSELQVRDAVGVGHSMGGHSLVHATAVRPELFSRLVLQDPTIRPREVYTGPVPEMEFVLKRRNQWDSPEQMFERFKDRVPFASWDRAILRDYCEYGLLPSETGNGFVLACPPWVEANIYANNSAKESDLYDEIAGLRLPVRVIRSSGEFDGSNFMASPTAIDLASHFPNGEDIPLTGISHFIPMEAPDLAAKLIG